VTAAQPDRVAVPTATAVAPAPISTYAVFDAMLERLATRTLFPKMQEVVVIGHSAGGQIVQRYAAVGVGPDRLAGSGVNVHFVVANPSSYLYFDTWRPQPQHGCSEYNDWRYGLVDAPAYVTGSASQLERRYAARDVTYLLGTADTIPNEWDLDTSCAAEAQGPYRFARGKNYIAYMRMRDPHGTSPWRISWMAPLTSTITSSSTEGGTWAARPGRRSGSCPSRRGG
jgi:pimeloyl-ACP methyl ester carboxylesterase